MEWLWEIEKVFDIIECLERLKIMFGCYMLVGDAKTWWHMPLEVHYGNDLSWEEFEDK